MPSITIRVDFDQDRRIGHGRIELLEMIGAHGSITRAAKAIGMSYKRAWYLLDDFGTMFAEPLIVRQHGGPGGGRAGITQFGMEIVSAYRSMEVATAAVCSSHVKAIEKKLARPAKRPKQIRGNR